MKSAVVGGKFYGSTCHECRQSGIRQANDASFQRARGRDDNARDIIQPFIDGKPNPDFAHAYPDQAEDMFTEEELKGM